MFYIVRLKPGMFKHHRGEAHKNTLHSKNPCWVKSHQLQTENVKEMKWNLHWMCTNCLCVISPQMIQYNIYLHGIYVAFGYLKWVEMTRHIQNESHVPYRLLYFVQRPWISVESWNQSPVNTHRSVYAVVPSLCLSCCYTVLQSSIVLFCFGPPFYNYIHALRCY